MNGLDRGFRGLEIRCSIPLSYGPSEPAAFILPALPTSLIFTIDFLRWTICLLCSTLLMRLLPAAVDNPARKANLRFTNGESGRSPGLAILQNHAAAALTSGGQQSLKGGSVSDKKMVVTLRTVAERVGLAPCSVSAVLNKTPASLVIPQRTKDRIFRAVAELNYQPNFSARSLRTKRTHMLAVISNDFGRAPVAQVVAGMERMLRHRGYLLALGVLDRPSEWTRLSPQLCQRGVEGVMAIGVTLPRELTLPAVSVHLGCLNFEEAFTPGPLAEDAGARLRELGESAAETVLSKIENKSAPRRTRIVFRPPHAAFTFPGAGLAGPAEQPHAD